MLIVLPVIGIAMLSFAFGYFVGEEQYKPGWEGVI